MAGPCPLPPLLHITCPQLLPPPHPCISCLPSIMPVTPATCTPHFHPSSMCLAPSVTCPPLLPDPHFFLLYHRSLATFPLQFNPHPPTPHCLLSMPLPFTFPMKVQLQPSYAGCGGGGRAEASTAAITTWPDRGWSMPHAPWP